MSDLLLAIPWWLFGSLIIVGGIVLWTGLQKQQKNSLYAGIALIVLALGLKTLSYFVETDKDKCIRQTTDLVSCVENRDWVKFASLLDDQVSLGTGESTIFGTRDQLIEGAKRDTETYHPTNVGTHIAHVEQDQTGVTVDIDVSCEGSMTAGYRIPTSWKITWQRSGKDWRVHEIICTKIGNSTANEMAHQIGR